MVTVIIVIGKSVSECVRKSVSLVLSVCQLLSVIMC